MKKRVLITVRTYPAPSRNSIEVSCTAGIDEDGRWIRLYPIPYRFLDKDKRFRKYQLIEANVTKAESDTRPESYKIDIDSIKILSEPIPTDRKWELRKAKVMPLMSKSLCQLQSERDRNKEPTLGFFKPRVISSLKLERTSGRWSEAELSRLTQSSFFDNVPRTQLEKLPFDFSYNFACNDSACKGHQLKCTDWEMGASYWAWRRKYSAEWEIKFRDTYETKMALERDTHFFVGTLSTHPSEWIIVGLFYPPK
ncbi:MAG: hypothetical protein HYX80_00445 [Chloroflexi bacterium]|nr:hypothetical protein [Chloroflexota bacterium]